MGIILKILCFLLVVFAMIFLRLGGYNKGYKDAATNYEKEMENCICSKNPVRVLEAECWVGELYGNTGNREVPIEGMLNIIGADNTLILGSDKFGAVPIGVHATSMQSEECVGFTGHIITENIHWYVKSTKEEE